MIKIKNLEKWGNIGVYVLAVIGVLFSKYMPEIMASGDLSSIALTIPSIGELAGALMMAAVLVGIMEKAKKDDDIAKHREGKIRNIKKRLFHAFIYGIFWVQIIQTFIGNLNG